MSQQALISGRLQGAPTTRPTRTGGEWTAFKLKVASGNRVEFWNVSTFSDTARSEIAGLGEGDALSAVGEISVETYQWNGETRVSLKLTADRILALKPKPAKPKDKPPRSSHAAGRAVAAASWAAPTLALGGAHGDDDIPF
jgi:hypothetical protein